VAGSDAQSCSINDMLAGMVQASTLAVACLQESPLAESESTQND
jgi:hypothetical protein